MVSLETILEKVNDAAKWLVAYVEDVASLLARSLLSHVPSGSRAMILDRLDVAKTIRDVLLTLAVIAIASAFVKITPDVYLVAGLSALGVYGLRRWLAVNDGGGGA